MSIIESRLLNETDISQFSEAYKRFGYVIIEDFFSLKTVSEIKKAIQVVKEEGDVDLYVDRSGNLRRMEHFTFKHEVFKLVNEELIKILFKLTTLEQIIFKDKVNFKPPKGEGFYPHFDGVFQYKTDSGEVKNGWYEYASVFNNCLICLDQFNLDNGTLEISHSHNEDFSLLLEKTKLDGSPNIRNDQLSHLDFQPILADAGSLIVFKHTCPHKSSPNYSNSDRGSLYLTYNNLIDGAFYEQYFIDKKKSINPNKSLQGDQISD